MNTMTLEREITVLDKAAPRPNPFSLYTIADMYLLDVQKLMELDTTDEAFTDTLESLGGEFEVKATNIAFFIKNLEATSVAIKSAEEQMTERRRKLDKRVDAIKHYLMTNMNRTGISKVESPYFNISLRANPESLVIDLDAKIPAEYLVQMPAPAPQIDRMKLKADMKEGVLIDGCHLERKMRLDIK